MSKKIKIPRDLRQLLEDETRGRKKMSAIKRRDIRKLYRWNILEIQLIEEAARISGKTASSLIRKSTLDVCRNIILNEELKEDKKS